MDNKLQVFLREFCSFFSGHWCPFTGHIFIFSKPFIPNRCYQWSLEPKEPIRNVFETTGFDILVLGWTQPLSKIHVKNSSNILRTKITSMFKRILFIFLWPLLSFCTQHVHFFKTFYSKKVLPIIICTQRSHQKYFWYHRFWNFRSEWDTTSRKDAC